MGARVSLEEARIKEAERKSRLLNKGPGPYVYADIYSLFPTSNTEFADIEPSFDMTICVDVRF